MSEYILEMRAITKAFPGVKALDDVTFSVRRGEIHALVGENGAGKSTLMKVLSGVHRTGSYQGAILVNGELQSFRDIRDAEAAGIAIIYQELALVKQMSVAENIYLGNEWATRGVIDWDRTWLETEKLLQQVGLKVSPGAEVMHLGVGAQQLVEIAKALSKRASILILDEPTAALTESETETLLAILRTLRQQGVTCIYISHKLSEVFSIADRITVLRDGKTIATEQAADLDEERLISLMVGRALTQVFPERSSVPGEVVLEVRDWTVIDRESGDQACHGINFQLRKGEILGISGLMGAGRTELAMSLFGSWGHVSGGGVFLDGKQLTIRSARDAIEAGISLVSEDRKRYGLVLLMDVKQNVTLVALKSISKRGVIDANQEIRAGEDAVGNLRIRTPSIAQIVSNLSGGNQQKVVLGKWLLTRPRVLILDEPTRGIDVGAKAEIYAIMDELRREGMSIIMISSELPEVLGMSDRILVMHEGRVAGTLGGQSATQEQVMQLATGGE